MHICSLLMEDMDQTEEKEPRKIGRQKAQKKRARNGNGCYDSYLGGRV